MSHDISEAADAIRSIEGQNWTDAPLTDSEKTAIWMALRFERDRALQIVREEWHRSVKEFGLQPGTPTEATTARILERIALSAGDDGGAK